MGTPLTERLVNRLAAIGQARPSRRTVLGTATLTGAALAVNPIGYITRPQSAYASVCGPGSNCNDGWSAMCCSINEGRNICPPNTYAGGWWKADRSSFCGGAARYYIDCNATRTAHYKCHCHQGSCDNRYVACNVFRYGQCNTQVPGITAVVCRQISCVPPWKLYPGQCGTSSATDNNTTRHSAPCLTWKNTHQRTVFFPRARTELHGGQLLRPRRQRLTSPDRHTTALFRWNGNFTISNQRGVVWSTRTVNKGRNT